MFHTYNRLIFWMGVLILILPVIGTAETQSQNAKTENSQSTQEAQEVQLHGSVVCLAEEMHELYHADVPSEHQHLYGFKAEDGTFYTLLRTNMSEALFADKRLHEALIIKGRTFPKTQILEAISPQSISAVTNTGRQNAKIDEPLNPQAAQEIQLRGRVVCLAEEMHTLYHADLPLEHQHLYGFKTEDETFYTLLRTALSEALFVDKRLHEKALIIKGRTFPHTQILEAISLRSVHNGVVYDLYYYCETCAIRAVSPGNCVCCGEPVELVEKPTNLQMSK